VCPGSEVTSFQRRCVLSSEVTSFQGRCVLSSEVTSFQGRCVLSSEVTLFRGRMIQKKVDQVFWGDFNSVMSHFQGPRHKPTPAQRHTLDKECGNKTRFSFQGKLGLGYVFSLTHAGCFELSPSLQDKVFDMFQEPLIHPHHLRDEGSYSCLWYVARHCVLLVGVRVDQSDCFIQQLYRNLELALNCQC